MPDAARKPPPLPGYHPDFNQEASGSDSGSEEESEEELERKAFTLKQLIRKLHISAPVNAVMCLIGKS